MPLKVYEGFMIKGVDLQVFRPNNGYSDVKKAKGRANRARPIHKVNSNRPDAYICEPARVLLSQTRHEPNQTQAL
jgi:hypothetical protein